MCVCVCVCARAHTSGHRKNRVLFMNNERNGGGMNIFIFMRDRALQCIHYSLETQLYLFTHYSHYS